MARVLVVDDERDLVWAVRYSLSDAGYEVLTAHDGMAALAVARRHPPDLIILDISMPGIDGLEVCRRVRGDRSLARVPILFLTVRSAVADRVKGLDQGADDYLVKPFDLGELKARVKALLRRSGSARKTSPGTADRGATVVAGGLALDVHARCVSTGTKSVSLTPTEFDFLHFLMTHPGEVFSSRRLLQQVWDYAPEMGGSSLVRWHVRNLRLKIESDPGHPAYIRTVPHHGYVVSGDA